MKLPTLVCLLGGILSSTTPLVSSEESTCSASTSSDASTSTTCAPTKIRLGLEWFLNPDHLPLIVAIRHGIFAEFDLDVELVEPSDHWEADAEIQAGRLDVAVTEPLHLAQDAARGKSVMGFSRFFHTDGGVMYDSSRSGIKRPRDMCGKTISYPGSPGPGGPAIVNTMVKADGGHDCPISSYKKHDGGFFHTDAIESGKADVATLVFWNFELPEARARGMHRVGFFSLKEWGVPDFCQLVLMTTPEKFEERKDVLRKLVLAMRRATGLIHQTPDLAKFYYREHVGGAAQQVKTEREVDVREATLTATLPAFPNDNMMSAEYYDKLMIWLAETDQVDADGVLGAPVSSYWTNEIAW